MNSFLVSYNRKTGRCVVQDYGTNGHTAMEARFVLEQMNREDVEVVVLAAANLAAARQTHSRYFGAGCTAIRR